MAHEDESGGQIGEPAPPPREQPPPPWKAWNLVQVFAVALAALVISGAVIAGLGGGFGGGGDTDEGSGEAEEAAPQPLRVTTNGEGSGAVTSVPAGIECGVACKEEFPAGALVRLKASPSKGSAFTGFSGDCAGTSQCTVSMDRARSVTATFEPD